jgi:hypothetical protein
MIGSTLDFLCTLLHIDVENILLSGTYTFLISICLMIFLAYSFKKDADGNRILKIDTRTYYVLLNLFTTKFSNPPLGQRTSHDFRTNYFSLQEFIHF